MPDADTVWLTPLHEMTATLERAGLAVTWQEDHSRVHLATAQALHDAFAADADAIAAQIGRRALDELLAAHRLWVRWLDAGRVRKFALVAEVPERPRRDALGASGRRAEHRQGLALGPLRLRGRQRPEPELLLDRVADLLLELRWRD